MSARIHPTAVIEVGAKIDPTVLIGAFSVIGAGARIGPEARIRPHVVIEGDVSIGEQVFVGDGAVIHGPAVIGDRSALFPYALVGQVAQFANHHKYEARVEIGSGTILREFVAVNKPVTAAATKVGAGCYLMARTQVDHDCVIESFVKTATGVTLGGSVHIEEHAYLGMNAVVHQGLRIGRACMIGMNGAVTAHVPPFTTLVDRRITRVNAIGLARIGATEADIARIDAYYRAGEMCDADDPWIRAIRDFRARVAPAATARVALTS
ncbi:MAG: hypothetical protein EKK43_13760 [Methylobacterium sp.]|uniref:DapH/DapD/GlmU-related protein n=1 Tax=Methylobacterium sp. TaxID=409 RepID=UPI000FC34EE9|nr:DapH/DapD/GlmU-related protein [Methylobacterium sp.]RUP14044.1 MAG: hypothetical protein EKK43_13760 [Methylobacterium sp.]